MEQIKNHLRREYSQLHMSAQRMLEEVLNGKQILRKDDKGLHTLILRLEKVYRKAKDTGRQHDNKDTTDIILVKRVDCLIQAWSVECGKKYIKWEPEFGAGLNGVHEPGKYDITFMDFLHFLQTAHRQAVYKNSIPNQKTPQRRFSMMTMMNRRIWPLFIRSRNGRRP